MQGSEWRTGERRGKRVKLGAEGKRSSIPRQGTWNKSCGSHSQERILSRGQTCFSEKSFWLEQEFLCVQEPSTLLEPTFLFMFASMPLCILLSLLSLSRHFHVSAPYEYFFPFFSQHTTPWRCPSPVSILPVPRHLSESISGMHFLQTTTPHPRLKSFTNKRTGSSSGPSQCTIKASGRRGRAWATLYRAQSGQVPCLHGTNELGSLHSRLRHSDTAHIGDGANSFQRPNQPPSWKPTTQMLRPLTSCSTVLPGICPPSSGAGPRGWEGTFPLPSWAWDSSPGQSPPLGQEGQAALGDMTSEMCSNGPGPIYHHGAIIRFVNIQSSVVLLTRNLITLLLSFCMHCSGWLFYL